MLAQCCFKASPHELQTTFKNCIPLALGPRCGQPLPEVALELDPDDSAKVGCEHQGQGSRPVLKLPKQTAKKCEAAPKSCDAKKPHNDCSPLRTQQSIRPKREPSCRQVLQGTEPDRHRRDLAKVGWQHKVQCSEAVLGRTARAKSCMQLMFRSSWQKGCKHLLLSIWNAD